ncbi:MAG: glycosyltransferase family A protein [Bdellovibrionales bacterium]
MNEKTPKVTVIVPCYNHGEYLEESVGSLLEQTFQDFKIYVINDGSTSPQTIEILEKFNKPKTTILHKKNGHLSSARNYGIARTDSEYICTLDADDMFDKNFLKEAVEVLDNQPEIGVVTSFQQDFGVSRALGDPGGGDVRNFLADNACLASSMYRRLCWVQANGYDENMKQGYEDWNFWVGVTKNKWKVHVLQHGHLKYRVKEVSMVTESNKIRPELCKRIAQNHIEVYKEHVADIVYSKELKIFNLKQEIEQLKQQLKEAQS